MEETRVSQRQSRRIGGKLHIERLYQGIQVTTLELDASIIIGLVVDHIEIFVR